MSREGVQLDRVNWKALTHACGPADDVPEKLRMLFSVDREVRLAAYDGLLDALAHQGSRCEASARAVPFVIMVVADPNAPDRYMACTLLAILAIGDESAWLADPSRVDRLRREVVRKSGMSADELDNELREWIAAARTEADRMRREISAEWASAAERRDAERWELETYDAVRAGITVYVEALESSDDLLLRLALIYLIGFLPDEAAVSVPYLVRLLAAESDTALVATAAIAAGLLGGGQHAELVAVLTRRLGSSNAGERWAAAIALARLSPAPDPAVVRELYACVAHAADGMPAQVPYLGGDMSSLAMLSVARLSPRVAPDRLDVLLTRLTSRRPGPSALLLGRSILQVAFPDGPVPPATAFADLSVDQRRAVVALSAGGASRNSFWLKSLFAHYGLSPDIGLPHA